MSYPIITHNVGAAAVFTPQDHLAYRRQMGQGPSGEAPQTMIFCLQSGTLRQAVKKQRGRKVSGFFGEVYRLQKQRGRIGVVGNFGLGAPVVAALLSEFAAWGVRRFVALGVAGGLQSHLAAGDGVLVTQAIRDEGASYHYLPPAKYALPSGDLTTWLQTADLPLTPGTSWTTDAPYRETAAALQQYQAEGVLTVEMEAAAFLAVGGYLGVETAVCLTVSDSLAGGRWRPAPDPRVVQRAQIHLLDELIRAIVALTTA